MECYKLTGDESPEEMDMIYQQIIDDYNEYGLVSMFEKHKEDYDKQN